MAYMSQENKKRIVKLAKPVLKKYGIKATFGVRHHSTLVCNIKSGSLDVRHHSTLVCNIKSGSLDFINNYCETVKNAWEGHVESVKKDQYIDVNVHHYEKHFSGDCLAFLKELITVMNDGNYDNSDAQFDYFDVGYYIDINVGKWDKPYVLC
jgi:hypothetical protein